MNLGLLRLDKRGYSLLGGVLFVAILSAFLRPRQQDNAHTIGILSASGGRAIHSGHFTLGRELFGAYTLLLTAEVLPPVAGDIRVQFQGPEPILLTLSSRNPPGLPLVNGRHAWYRFEDPVLQDVQPFDDLVLYVRLRAPQGPGEYALVLSDAADSSRIYLRLPVEFSRPGPGAPAQDPLQNWPCH